MEIADWDDPKLDAGLQGENPLSSISRSLFELAVIRWRMWTRYYN